MQEYTLVEIVSLFIDYYRYKQLQNIFQGRLGGPPIIPPEDQQEGQPPHLSPFYSSEIASMEDSGYWYHMENRESHLKMNVLATMVHCVQLFIFVYGNMMLLFHVHNCLDKASELVTIMLVLLLLGFFSYLKVIFLAILIILCIPYIIIVAMRMNTPDQEPASQVSLDHLPIRLYGELRTVFLEKEEEHETECTICKLDYEVEDKLVVLPCSDKHFFHEECIKRWL